jgi:hypothetical protein
MIYIFLTLAGAFTAIHFYGFYNFLDLFAVADENPPRIKRQPATVAATPETVPEGLQVDRAILEIIAQNVKTAAGYKGDIVTLTEKATDAELIDIINKWY